MLTAINRYCPRLGKPAVADSLTSYAGKTVGFCNPHCRDDFRDNQAERPADRAYFDAILKETGQIVVEPSPESSKDDFDFLEGKWNVKNRKLNQRLAGCDEWSEFDAVLEMRKTLRGIGNFETFSANINGEAFEGEAVRVFDPATCLWSIYSADSVGGTLDRDPVIGSFAGSLGKFYAKDTFKEKEVTILYQWDKTDPAHPIWSQALSTDGGETWEWNWYMNFSRAETADDRLREAV